MHHPVSQLSLVYNDDITIIFSTIGNSAARKNDVTKEKYLKNLIGSIAIDKDKMYLLL